MKTSLRVGLVSTSWWADRMHVPAIQSHESAKLVACCGRNAYRAKEFAAKHGIPAAYCDFRGMIEKEQLDVIVIATPESSHHEICLAAAQGGIHIVCEKPISMNAALAKEMLEAAESSGVKHMTYFTWRWVPWLRYAKQLIEGGDLGRIYESNIRFAMGSGRSGQSHWKWDQKHGLGALGDMGSHVIDLAHWLIGPIVDIDARLQSFITRPDYDGESAPSCDSALMNVGFEGGGHACLEATAVEHLGAHLGEWRVELFGEAGSLRVEFDFANGWRCWSALGDDEGGPVAIPDTLFEGVDKNADFRTQFGQLFTTQSVGIRLFLDAILDGSPVEPTLLDGYRAQLVMDAAVAASSQKRRVRVSTDL